MSGGIKSHARGRFAAVPDSLSSSVERFEDEDGEDGEYGWTEENRTAGEAEAEADIAAKYDC